MQIDSPIVDAADADLEASPYGTVEGAPLVPLTFGQLDFEYASLRKACVLVDLPHRAVIEVSGADRLSFLQRMLTQQLLGDHPLTGGGVRRSFWLNRKGRVVGDLLLVELGDRMLVDVDPAAADATIESLEGFVFSEDIKLVRADAGYRRLGLHGPTAALLLERFGFTLGENGAALDGQIAGQPLAAARSDTAGVPGYELFVPREHARAVCDALRAEGEPRRAPGEPSPRHDVSLRRAGWLAYNTARIEAGCPLFMIDFDSRSVPAETGLMDQRVDFRKGCYLGQEVVARMHAQGNPKQRVVRLRFEDAGGRQPVGGTTLHDEADPTGTVLGTITSSTVSPMLGGEPVALAMVRFNRSSPGSRLAVRADGAALTAVVQNDAEPAEA